MVVGIFNCNIRILPIFSRFPHKMTRPKNVSFYLYRPVCTLFHKSGDQCRLSNSRKSAIEMPLFEKGEPQRPSSYRQISLLSCVGNLMKGVDYHHLYNHCVSYTCNLIYSKQSIS